MHGSFLGDPSPQGFIPPFHDLQICITHLGSAHILPQLPAFCVPILTVSRSPRNKKTSLSPTSIRIPNPRSPGGDARVTSSTARGESDHATEQISERYDVLDTINSTIIILLYNSSRKHSTCSVVKILRDELLYYYCRYSSINSTA